MNKTNEIIKDLKDLIELLESEGYDLDIVAKAKDHLNELKAEVPLLSPVIMTVWDNGQKHSEEYIIGKLRIGQQGKLFSYIDLKGRRWDNAVSLDSEESLLDKLKDKTFATEVLIKAGLL